MFDLFFFNIMKTQLIVITVFADYYSNFTYLYLVNTVSCLKHVIVTFCIKSRKLKISNK